MEEDKIQEDENRKILFNHGNPRKNNHKKNERKKNLGN